MRTVAEALRQVIEGQDYDAPDKLLRNVSAEDAVTKLPGWPYSIATNVAHTDHWNKIWLARLSGVRAPTTFPDFPDVAPEEWEGVRNSFLENLTKAYEIAKSERFNHNMKSDEIADKLLFQISNHTSYQLGQVKLLKRLLRACKMLG